MTKVQLNQLHPKDIPLWFSVEAAVWRLVHAANLHVRSVGPIPRAHVGQYQGIYYYAPQHRLELSLRGANPRNPKAWGSRYTLYQLLDTICHEVAHVATGPNRGDDHGSKFFRNFAKVIELSEDIGLRYELRSSRVSLRE